MQELKSDEPGATPPSEAEARGELRSARPASPEDARSAREEFRRLYRFEALTDCLSVAIGLLAAYAIRFGVSAPATDFLAVLLVSPLFVVGFFAAFRLYDAHQFTPAEEFRRIILAASVALAALVTVAFWWKSALSRGWIALSWGLVVALTLLTRRAWHWHMGRAREQGRYSFRTLIVGTNGEAEHLAVLMDRVGFGFRSVGFVSSSSADGTPDEQPVRGTLADLRDIIRDTGAECVFVASTEVGVAEMGHIAKVVRLEGVEVRITATLPEVLSSRLSVQPFGGLMALSLKPARLTGSQAVFKRAFDLTVAGLGLAVTSFLSIPIAVAIKLTSPGPLLYRQRRVGQRGRPFTMLKFRTMVEGAEGMREALLDLNEASGPLFKLKDDPRVTRVGRWLRKWSLDELPQLLNVLRGDMSIVGPRPPLPEEVRVYEEWQFDRLEVRPGITGLWQVSGRSELSFDEYVRLDLFYIENWSLAYDLFIVAKTVPILLSRRGAY